MIPTSSHTSASSASEPAPNRMMRAGAPSLTPMRPRSRRETAEPAGDGGRPLAGESRERVRDTCLCPSGPRAIEISRLPSMPSIRASTSAPEASSASTAAREMNVTP